MEKSNVDNIKRLRELTGSPMGDCKSALEESGQDLEAARILLKKKGLLVGVLRGAKGANQGIITATTTKDTPNETVGLITCLSCETDFVAKLKDFISTAKEISIYAMENHPTTLELLRAEFEEKISELRSTAKENIQISHYEHMDGEHISIYNHQTNRLSVLVKFNKEFEIQVGKNVAMQVASMKPLFVDYDDIPQSVIDAEKKLAFEKTQEQEEHKDKADDMIEKISKGRLDKQMDQMTLLNQLYTQRDTEKNNKQTVRQYLESIDNDLKVVAFRSFEIG